MLRNTKEIVFLIFLYPIILVGAIRYSCPIRVLTNIRLLGKFQPDPIKLRD